MRSAVIANAGEADDTGKGSGMMDVGDKGFMQESTTRTRTYARAPDDIMTIVPRNLQVTCEVELGHKIDNLNLPESYCHRTDTLASPDHP